MRGLGKITDIHTYIRTYGRTSQLLDQLGPGRVGDNKTVFILGLGKCKPYSIVVLFITVGADGLFINQMLHSETEWTLQLWNGNLICKQWKGNVRFIMLLSTF